MRISPRFILPVIGMGLLEAIPEATIQEFIDNMPEKAGTGIGGAGRDSEERVKRPVSGGQVRNESALIATGPIGAVDRSDHPIFQKGVCSDASRRSLAQRRILWLRRIARVSRPAELRRLFFEAGEKCELQRWRDRKVMLDLIEQPAGWFKLRDMIHEFNLAWLDGWCHTAIDCVLLADDWGSQRSLLISPILWRELFKPLYADYIARARAAVAMSAITGKNAREFYKSIPDIEDKHSPVVQMFLYIY